MAIGIPEYRLPREVLRAEIDRIVGLGRRPPPGRGRWAATSRLNDLERAGVQRDLPRHRRPEEPAARRPRRRPDRGRSPRPSSSSRSTSARGRGCPAGSSSSAAAAPRWTRRGPRSAAAPARSPSSTAAAFKEMPAQAEEIEAAEREGIAFRIGATVTEVLGANGAVRAVRDHRAGADRRRGERPRDLGARPGLRGHDRRRRDPRRDRRGAGPVDPARGRRHRDRAPGPGSPPTRGRWPRAGPACSPGATSSAARRRSSTRSRPAGVRPGRSTSTCRARPMARPTSWPPSAIGRRPSRASRLDLEPRARAHPPLPVVDPTTFRATQAGFGDADGPERGESLLPVRRRLRLLHRPRRDRTRAGRRSRSRPAAGHQPDPGRARPHPHAAADVTSAGGDR